MATKIRNKPTKPSKLCNKFLTYEEFVGYSAWVHIDLLGLNMGDGTSLQSHVALLYCQNICALCIANHMSQMHLLALIFHSG